MDISGYISELLYGHDCVIIPGFGGFICNYKPAEIDHEGNTISPPGKSISFNKNLQTNDGLLVNHIAKSKNLSFDIASTVVEAWVVSSNALLASDEELSIKQVGRIFKDVEGNLQFQPDTSVNYLRSSFGLRTIPAVPVVKQKQIDFEERKRRRRRKILRPAAWRMAAMVLIVVSIVGLFQMMMMGIQIKPLNLNEASVVSFVNSLFKTEEHKLRPIPVEMPAPMVVDTLPVTPEQELVTYTEQAAPVANTTTTSPPKQQPVALQQPVPANTVPGVVNDGSPSYYVIIGAFKDDANAAKAKAKLLQRYPEQNIYFEKKSTLTKVGFYVGNNASVAKELLDSAHTEDASYWLMKK